VTSELIPDAEPPAFGHEPPTEAELKAHAKRDRRRAREASDRRRAREREAEAEAAVDAALALAPVVAELPAGASDRAIPVAVDSVETATYLRRRVNEALAAGEWLDEVEVWVWDAHRHQRGPLTEHGRDTGVELRMERTR
jgi:hypothetical protein